MFLWRQAAVLLMPLLMLCFQIIKRVGLVSNCCICLIRYENSKFYLDKFNDISYRIEGEEYFQGVVTK